MADSASTDLSRLSKSREANWPAVLFYIHIHLLSLYGIWLLFFDAKLLTVLLRTYVNYYFFTFPTRGNVYFLVWETNPQLVASYACATHAPRLASNYKAYIVFNYIDVEFYMFHPDSNVVFRKTER